MFEYRTSRFWKDILSHTAKHQQHPEHELDVKLQPNFLRERFGIPWDAALMLSSHGVLPALTDHQGFVDEVTPAGVRGWAINLRQTERPVDVVAAGYPNKATGFFIALPAKLTSNGFTARIAGSGELLQNGRCEGF
jgi:hypothetical protein